MAKLVLKQSVKAHGPLVLVVKDFFFKATKHMQLPKLCALLRTQSKIYTNCKGLNFGIFLNVIFLK